MRPKKCRICKTWYTPQRVAQSTCEDVKCALLYGREVQAKEYQRVTRQRKKAMKSRGSHLKDAQAIFNKWVRLRDADLPCVSCGRWHEGQWHCGHYKSVGGNSSILRFEPDNCAKQCAPCNNFKSGALDTFRIELIKRIGLDRVEWLEGPHEPHKYEIEEIEGIKKKYRAAIKELTNSVEC